MAMNYIVVQSSNIAKIGYNKDTGELGVIFNNGGEYIYPGVSEEIYNDFMSASSHGHYHYENIKYTFAFRRIN